MDHVISHTSQRGNRLPRTHVLDAALDAAIVPGFSRIGYALRRLPPVDTRMDGRTVLVTGATGGIGRAAALALSRLGARIVAVGRSDEKLSALRDEVVAAGGAARTERADLSLLTDIRALAERLRGDEERIHVLVNNVGVLLPERRETPEGFEATFATNLLGQFALTTMLLPLLEGSETDPGRIVTVSSGGMYTVPLEVDRLESRDDYRGALAYARTKRAQVVLAEEWAHRLADRRIVSNAMHPGWADTDGVDTSLPRFHTLTAPILRTPEQGADTIVWLAAAPEGARHTALFWHDRRPRPTHRLRSTRTGRTERDALWATLEGIVETIPTTGATT